jgi:serine/threonine protein kinase
LALAPGSRLGPYEIVAAIGAGGMGEVYRALDTRLESFKPLSRRILTIGGKAQAMLRGCWKSCRE